MVLNPGKGGKFPMNTSPCRKQEVMLTIRRLLQPPRLKQQG